MFHWRDLNEVTVGLSPTAFTAAATVSFLFLRGTYAVHSHKLPFETISWKSKLQQLLVSTPMTKDNNNQHIHAKAVALAS